MLPAWIPVLLLLLSGVALTVAQGPARAEPATGPAPILLELFTSQGCSSCPPADALLRRLAADPDVIAIALHVDYWDYLGWRDPFAARATRPGNGPMPAMPARRWSTPRSW
ncbi:MAG: DUF1223 domain-containing protein [Rhodobacteraceae bacterium]|nr:DUF1223 domain-containing protein [Paracoccaceae bacterium]